MLEPPLGVVQPGLEFHLKVVVAPKDPTVHGGLTTTVGPVHHPFVLFHFKVHKTEKGWNRVERVTNQHNGALDPLKHFLLKDSLFGMGRKVGLDRHDDPLAGLTGRVVVVAGNNAGNGFNEFPREFGARAGIGS